ncbi:hypothetical protein [Pedobacter rhizosphaerae]|uniref:O-Methyltransferase involved in polyketide biosynthesis n=1 Tax=Pedobacter rhizosphaerae TaxID=390241 RepID=A0A1H9K5R9_9SPHI|nr:hypothetical protein [Pedobacter rhizosphaerae]SEQ94459.1 hypothetical protein SAMN04488023_102229 [Pedobacter rhizosphaerae]
MQRDYSSISPSAKMLLLTKGLTNIPFIADAAKIIWGNDALDQLATNLTDELFLKRLIHFESRYLSLDSLLFASGSLNVLEISSGFSFRGLNMASHHANICYKDTDLSEIISIKKDLTQQLIRQEHLSLRGKLITESLNALDHNAFASAVESMPAGRLSIVNEGLLMYLNHGEKAQLCQTIRKALLKRGGYWITGDIYIKKELEETTIPDAFNQFLQAHHVEENKFDSFQQAEAFFKEQGLLLTTKATSVWHQLSAVKYADPALLSKWVKQSATVGKIRETWALKAI